MSPITENSAIELELAVDRPGYFRVGHNGIVVAPTMSGLEVFPRVPDKVSIQDASNLAMVALEQLPETPVSAAGVNIRYELSELPDAVQDLVKALVDDVLSDEGFRIQKKAALRTLEISPGVLNLQITDAMPGGALEFNFHHESTQPSALRDWLSRATDFAGIAERILSIIGVTHVGREVNV